LISVARHVELILPDGSQIVKRTFRAGVHYFLVGERSINNF